ncbi:MAG: tetratricopeptide repeat protein [Anaerolineae bacterium]|nr:tetratricopeptide repeat protein [Anaerolineae bacterium]
MYLRTPKRYRGGQKRSIISLRWLWLWILTPLVVYGGIQIYNNRETIGPPIHDAIYSVVDNAQSGLATAVAPTPFPTQNPSENLTRAEADWRDGRIEAALQGYQNILDAVPNNVQAYYRVTLGLIMEGSEQEALEIAERTVTAGPFASDAWAIRAMALNENGRYGEAIASSLRALELNPDNARAMAFLAEAYKNNENFDLATSTADRAVEIDPDSFEALRARGLIAQDIEFDLFAAKDYYQQAYAAAPNMPYLAVDLARMYYFVDQDSELAIATINDIVETNPQNSLALYWLGYFYYNGQGNFSQAAEFLSRCVDSNPQSILCLGLLGRVQLALGNNNAAIESLQLAIDLDTPWPRHYLWMGRAQIAQGNCPAAIPFLEMGYPLAQDSGDDEALTAIQENLTECRANIPGITLPEATAEATVEAGS